MDINFLKKHINKFDKIKITGKDFKFNGTDFHFVGFYLENNSLMAVVLSYNEELFERKEQAKNDLLNAFDLDSKYKPTVRESQRHHLLFNEPPLHITKIISGKTEIHSQSSNRTCLGNDIDENVILVMEFIRAGWNCDKLSHVPFNRLSINKIVFEGIYNEIPEFSEKFTLSFAKTSESVLAEIPVSIEIGENKKEINLPTGESVFIRDAKLLDMYDEMEKFFKSKRFSEMYTSDETEEQQRNFTEKFSLCCPKGKYYIAVEYETGENTSVEIKLKSILDSPPLEKESCMAFLIRSDSSPIHNGMTVKTAVIDVPFDADTKLIEAEIFTVSTITNPDDVTI